MFLISLVLISYLIPLCFSTEVFHHWTFNNLLSCVCVCVSGEGAAPVQIDLQLGRAAAQRERQSRTLSFSGHVGEPIASEHTQTDSAFTLKLPSKTNTQLFLSAHFPLLGI